MGRLERLTVLAEQQERLLSGCEPQQFAALSREYRATLLELESVAPAESQKGSPLDELAKRRSGRGATA